MRRLFILFTLLSLVACSKPIADFKLLSESSSAPVAVNFKNTSTGAEEYQWFINGEAITDSFDMDHVFLSSGRYRVDLKATKGGKQNRKAKEFIVNAPDECIIYMETTLGHLAFSLSDLTPNHRDNFLELVESNYYDGIAFHRVIDGFMIQAGDDKTKESKKRIRHKDTIDEEIDNSLVHLRGAIAAARMPDDVNPERASSGTQFYIVDGRDLKRDELESIESGKLFDYTEENFEDYIEKGGAPQLDGEYTVFGFLLDGFDVLEKISVVKTDNRNNPIEPVRILKVISIN